MTLSDHRNENSLKSYNARRCALMFSHVCTLNPQATQADLQMQVF